MVSIHSIPTEEHHVLDSNNSQSNFHHFKITTPHENDVLLGRGTKNREHIGNLNLKDVARRCSNLYAKAARKDKPCIASEIVRKISMLVPSGRFLKQDPTTLEWKEVSHEVAQEKVSQCLRDIVSSRRRQRQILSRRNEKIQADQSLRIEYSRPGFSSRVTLAALNDAACKFNHDSRVCPAFVAVEPVHEQITPMISRFLPWIFPENEIQMIPMAYKTAQGDPSVNGPSNTCALKDSTHMTTDFMPNLMAEITGPNLLSELDTQQKQGNQGFLKFHVHGLVEPESSFYYAEGQHFCANRNLEPLICPCPENAFLVEEELDDISIVGDCMIALNEAENFDYSTVFDNHTI